MKKTDALAVQTKTAAKGDSFHPARPTRYMEGSVLVTPLAVLFKEMLRKYSS